MMLTKKYPLTTLIVLSVSTLLFSLCHGNTPIPFTQFTHLFSAHVHTVNQDILLQLRLPRTLSAFVTGGLLALAGALMQVLLRNPLADPYTLGISGGSAVFSLLLIVMGVTGIGLTGGSWLGSLLAIVLVFTLSRSVNGWNTSRLLLTGVALSSGFSAIISFILVLSAERDWHNMLFWMLGDLSFAHLPRLEALILVGMLAYTYHLAPALNILVRGEQEAKALGVNTLHLQYQLYVISALLTAAAVTLGGCIGFIGLIVPHLLRQWGIHHHRVLLPCAVLAGGCLLTVADTLARTVFAPQQLPVGIMTALLGIPLFIVLLHKRNA